MKVRSYVVAILLAIMLLPGLSFAEEKKATVVSYDEGSRMLTVKGRDWEATAKVRSSDAADKKDLLTGGTRVLIELDDRGGGDVRVKSIAPR